MEADDETAIICATVILVSGVEITSRKKINRRNRRVWVKKWLCARNEKGAYNNMLNELKLTDFERFRRFLRMYSFVLSMLTSVTNDEILICFLHPKTRMFSMET